MKKIFKRSRIPILQHTVSHILQIVWRGVVELVEIVELVECMYWGNMIDIVIILHVAFYMLMCTMGCCDGRVDI